MSSEMLGLAFVLVLVCAACAFARTDDRVRIRDLDVRPGVLEPGSLNAITDVEGVAVGHRTIVEGDARTGVTAILPHGGNLYRRKVVGAAHVANAFGKAAGLLQVRELGEIETPIVLTNTLSVGTAVSAVVRWTLDMPGNEDVRSVNAVVGETNDGALNDIRGGHVTEADVLAAIRAARGGPVEEGSLGAGTGTRAFGWKGGIGTSSRVLPESLGGYTVGALVQANFGGVLVIDGVRVGERLGRYSFRRHLEAPRPANESDDDRDDIDKNDDGDGSCMIVIATDAPLSPNALERVARRAVLGLARTGSFMSNGSGDFVIAFTTHEPIEPAKDPTDRILRREILRNEALSPLFLATVESVEEAVYNALCAATTVTSANGRTVEAIPIERLREVLRGEQGAGEQESK